MATLQGGSRGAHLHTPPASPPCRVVTSHQVGEFKYTPDASSWNTLDATQARADEQGRCWHQQQCRRIDAGCLFVWEGNERKIMQSEKEEGKRHQHRRPKLPAALLCSPTPLPPAGRQPLCTGFHLVCPLQLQAADRHAWQASFGCRCRYRCHYCCRCCLRHCRCHCRSCCHCCCVHDANP